MPCAFEGNCNNYFDNNTPLENRTFFSIIQLNRKHSLERITASVRQNRKHFFAVAEVRGFLSSVIDTERSLTRDKDEMHSKRTFATSY